MELSVFYDTENDIIVTKPVAEITMENIRFVSLKVLELSDAHNCNYIFIDLTECILGQTLLEGFLGMQNMRESTGLNYNHICAVLYKPEFYPDDRAQFIENVVANRINPTLKMFKKYNEALKWLKEKQEHLKE